MIVVFASINDKAYHKGTVSTMCVTKLGTPGNLDIFTPTASIVFGHKCYNGDSRYKQFTPVDDETYIRIYANLLKSRSQEIRVWIDALEEDNTLCCFCKYGVFCHRKILAKWFKSYKPSLDIMLY
jgi:hypothetical protein